MADNDEDLNRESAAALKDFLATDEAPPRMLIELQDGRPAYAWLDGAGELVLYALKAGE